ncbi:unnamed protein product [Adineta steineri]|uniref:cyclin-dependent kinase n=1 Tax=Adineta steineri TaxID=433720 RepID=A0A818JZB6_9BILA|nr:unnamed protein product [Adineta steineri]
MKHIPANVKNKYEILGVIGEGSYGIVLKARKKDTNAIVAIKQFKQAPAGHYTDMDIIERELNVLQSLRFENVVELIEWFRHKKQCFLVFEYVEWNMLQVLQEHPDGLALEQVRHLSSQLFNAIHWCHTHEIIHRDIKPENLLISKNFILKLCDFGFARFCNTQTSADFYTDYVATRWYRSPELLIGSPYGKPVDIWACGCIMAELATGQALFAGESDIDQLYRIQKCLGPLPSKYVEAMKTNPKFDGLKFPPIHHLETLERRYGHLFPPDVMSLFTGALRLYALERFTAEACIQHEAFTYASRKQRQRRSRQQRPKTVVGIIDISQSQYDPSNDTRNFPTSFGDSRLGKYHDNHSDIQLRRRSPTSSINNGIDSGTEISAIPPSSFASQPYRYRSNTQMTDRSHTSHQQQQIKTNPTQLRPHSSSSEECIQPTSVDLINSNGASADDDDDDDDDPNNIFSNHNNQKRKYIKNLQAQHLPSMPLNQQQSLPITSSTSKNVLSKTKQSYQKQSNRILHNSSKDAGKKHKRFTLDSYENRYYQQFQTVLNNQQVPESNISRLSMAAVPSLNINASGVPTNNNNSHNVSLLSFKQSQSRDESNSDIQQKPKTRDLVRSRTVECHPSTIISVEPTPNFQRAPSRQTVISHQQIVPDPMDQTDVETTVSATYSTTRNLEQPYINKYPCNLESRKSTYASDSHLINSTGYTSSFSRSHFPPTKGDFAQLNKILQAPQRETNHDLIKSAKISTKHNSTLFPKPPTESTRRQQLNTTFFGVHSYARTASQHTILSTSQRQQSIRLPSTKSRLHDR